MRKPDTIRPSDHGMFKRSVMHTARNKLFKKLKMVVSDARVMEAMQRVDRAEFVPENVRERAYEDVALPIGAGQTISQPFMVGIMTAALRLRRSDTVLEVGTGSGYQAAIIAEIASRVVTVERVPSLANTAWAVLSSMGHDNIDGHLEEEIIGRPADGPYDAILVTAAAPKLITELITQLKDTGRMIIPVGTSESQELLRVTRSGGDYSVETLVQCRFVPLIGESAWPESALDRWGQQ